ncbi:MAG: substrate-binding domain-containing protein [Verrucomicrobiales bacterium]
MSKSKLILLALVAAATGIIYLLRDSGKPSAGGAGDAGDIELTMFCAAGIKEPVSRLAADFEKETGIKVALQYGGSGTLLSSMEIAPPDIYLAADQSYTDLAAEKGLVGETFAAAIMRAGFGVPKGNPLGLSSLADLRREGLRIGLANPDAASVGKFTKKILSAAGAWEPVEPQVKLFTPTVNELANAMKLGQLDVAILWDAVAAQYPEIDFVPLPEFDAEPKHVSAAVGVKSAHPTEAIAFCRFLAAPDRGGAVFRETGYEPAGGDRWALRPAVTLFSGAMLQPAIRETIREFEAREGCTVATSYNGCGVLVAQIEAGAKPDAYFSCDQSFLDLVEDRFAKGRTVSANDMVILVQKGNPKAIASLADLAAPGLGIAFAHPEKSALGALTVRLLEREGLAQKIADSGNQKLDSATGDFLVNQIATGSLDAVIVYRSNALAHAGTLEKCDLVEIKAAGAKAVQPYAVAKDAKFPRLMDRLLDAITSAEGEKRFRGVGFEWRLEPAP